MRRSCVNSMTILTSITTNPIVMIVARHQHHLASSFCPSINDEALQVLLDRELCCLNEGRSKDKLRGRLRGLELVQLIILFRCFSIRSPPWLMTTSVEVHAIRQRLLCACTNKIAFKKTPSSFNMKGIHILYFPRIPK